MPSPAFETAIARLHAAMAKVANGDTSEIMALYSHTDDATSFYGWGGYEKGWDAVAKRWRWAGQQFKGGTVSYQNVSTVVTAELACTTDVETFEARMEGMDQPAQWSNRVTHVFRLEDGEWRLVHRHANRLETQYTPVDAVEADVMDPLRIYGNLSLLEMAPVLLAADKIYPGKTLVEHGSVMSLWGASSDLASLGSAGQSDLAANSETQTLRGAAAHPDLRVVFTVAECPYRIVARRSAGIGGLADLRGKRVGTQLESSAAYFLDSMLKTAGLTENDVVAVPFMAKTPAPLTLIPEALLKGQIDAVALWEPQVERAKLALGEDAIEFRDPAVYTEKFNLCTTQAKLDDPAMRKSIVAFVRALIEAAERLKHDPEIGCRLVARAAGLDIETVRSAWPHFDYPGTLAADLLDIFERQDVWIAKTQGRAPRTREALATLIDESVLLEAATAA